MLRAILAATPIPSVCRMAALKLGEITMNEERFLTLLANLIGQVGSTQ